MPTEVLKRLQGGGTFSVAQLAAELKTSPDMISASLDFLAKQGYIHQVSMEVQGCAGGCKNCGGECNMASLLSASQGTMWEMIEPLQ